MSSAASTPQTGADPAGPAARARSRSRSKPYFKLFAACIPVKGARRSIVCDLQRGTIRSIPQLVYDFLTLHKNCTVEAIKDSYRHRHDDLIDESIAILESQELGFWCDDPTLFPDLDLTWDRPGLITNAIIDFGPSAQHDMHSIVRQLDDLHCAALQMCFYERRTFAEIQSFLVPTMLSRLRSIELIIKFSSEITADSLRQLWQAHPRISVIVVHSSPAGRLARDGADHIVYHTDAIGDSSHCGFVSPAYFNINIPAFTEAQRFNTCLNRKISIDADGIIRNCPAMARGFGNVKDVPLGQALSQAGFAELWDVSKDRIEVCRDCEFRYVCTDCRAVISDPSNILSKPARCRYDPYEARWSE